MEETVNLSNAPYHPNQDIGLQIKENGNTICRRKGDESKTTQDPHAFVHRQHGAGQALPIKTDGNTICIKDRPVRLPGSKNERNEDSTSQDAQFFLHLQHLGGQALQCEHNGRSIIRIEDKFGTFHNIESKDKRTLGVNSFLHKHNMAGETLQIEEDGLIIGPKDNAKDFTAHKPHAFLDMKDMVCQTLQIEDDGSNINDNLRELPTNENDYDEDKKIHNDMVTQTLQIEDDGSAICIKDKLDKLPRSNNEANEDKMTQNAHVFHHRQDMTGLALQIEDGKSTICSEKKLGKLFGSYKEAKTIKNPHKLVEKQQDYDKNTHAIMNKTPKKPVKALPCPRCDSMDTKFCYYNNYNVSQPRHFCKNCHRYWTAGGALRNLPVGAGRRRNKPSCSNQTNFNSDRDSITGDSPDAAQNSPSGSLSFTHIGDWQERMTASSARDLLLPLDERSLTSLENPSSTTSFGSGKESSFCERMVSTSLNLHHQGGIREHEPNVSIALPQDVQVGLSDLEFVQDGRLLDQGNDSKNNSCNQIKNKNQVDNLQNCTQMQEFASSYSNIPCFDWKKATTVEAELVTTIPREPPSILKPTPVWFTGAFPFINGYNVNCNNGFYPILSSGTVKQEKNNVSSCLSPSLIINENNNCLNLVQDTASVAASFWNAAYPGISWPYMHPTMWNAASWGSICSMPWVFAAAAASAVAMTNNSSNSLGKHPRESLESEGGNKGSLWIPKTLRIDDPGEAAKSSIWTTLGLGYRSESKTCSRIPKESQPKG